MNGSYWTRGNRVTRRGLLQGASLLAGGAAVGSLLAACAGGESGKPASTAPAAADATGTPAPRGTLNVAVPTLGTERWLLRTATGQEFPLIYMTEPLLGWDWEKDEPVNTAILEGWNATQNADGSSDWTFKIRKGVKFHKNWGEVTAEDVKFAFTILLQPGTIVSGAGPVTNFFGKDPENLVVQDPYTLRIHAPKPFNVVMLLRSLSADSLTGGVRPFPKKYYEQVGEEEFARNPVYAGPYEFVSQKQGYDTLLRAVPDFFRVTPGFAELHFLKTQDEATMVSMLQTQQVDIAAIPPRQVDGLKRAGLKIVVSKNTNDYFMGLGGIYPDRPAYDPSVPWCGRDPMSENPIKVRKALNLAVDRQAIVDKILYGYGSPGIIPFSFIGPGNPWWKEEWKPIPFDVRQAKQLLAEAGYPNGFNAKLWLFNNFPYSKDIGQAVADMWEKNLNVKLEARLGDYSPTFREMFLNRNTSGWIYSFQGGPINRPSSYACLLGGPKTQSIAHEELPFYTELCAQMERTTSVDQVVRLEQQLGDAEYSAWAEVDIAMVDQPIAVGPKVKSYTPAPKNGAQYRLEYVQPA